MPDTEIAKEITALQAAAAKAIAEAENLVALAAAYPDLQKNVDRWRNVRYSSAMVNDIVDKCEIRYSCGCCSDSSLQAWPYLETLHGRVYSFPPCFTVGFKNEAWLYSNTVPECLPNPGWEAKMSAANIPYAILDKVQLRFGGPITGEGPA